MGILSICLQAAFLGPFKAPNPVKIAIDETRRIIDLYENRKGP